MRNDRILATVRDVLSNFCRFDGFVMEFYGDLSRIEMQLCSGRSICDNVRVDRRSSIEQIVCSI